MSVTRRGLKMPKRDFPSMTVKAGILEAATYPADEIKDARTGKTRTDPRAGMHVATIAAALEYGHGQNHPRPFMQQTAAERRDEWATAARKLIASGMSIREALTTVGQVMKEDIKTTITDWPADNSPEWAAQKGFNAGLRFTEHMLDSIESEIESGN